MALEPSTTYNTKDDMIYGFENFGRNEKNRILCDYELIFLLRGIHRKGKQPIAYYFFQSVTKTLQLIKCINKVFAAVQTTGLKKMSTVCYLSAVSIKTINILKGKINRENLQKKRLYLYITHFY